MFRNICLGDKTSSNNFFAFLYKVKTVISLGVREGNRGVLLEHLSINDNHKHVNWKKMHSLKVESSVLFGGLSEEFKPRRQLSDSSKGLLWRGKQGASIIGVL